MPDTAVLSSVESSTEPSELPLERVEAEICTLAGQIAAATCRFLTLLAVFDAREGWAGWQVKSCAQWLSWRCGLDLRTAREHVRVARALTALPRVAEAFGAGRLSYSKVRALTRAATPETEADLLDAALCSPASQVERLVRGLTAATEEPADARQSRTGVQWRWNDDGTLAIWGRLAAEDGARLLAGLTRLEHERLSADQDERPTRPSIDDSQPDRALGGGSAGPEDSAESTTVSGGSAEPSSVPIVDGGAPADLGPALVAAAELACTTTDAPIHAPAAEVVVHVDVDTFVDAARQAAEVDAEGERPEPRPTDRRPAHLEDGPGLTAATVQLLACDGRLQLSVDGPDGRTLDLGRRRRRPTNRQLVALWRRDHGCAVPGCGRTRFLHAHHVRAWVLGGRTSLDNLVLLCGQHHRLLHEGGFAIAALGGQRFTFSASDGRTVSAAPTTQGTAAALTTTHGDIRPSTIEPDWDGSSLNLTEAVTTYLTEWQHRLAG
jgi:hypothetical protein